MIKPKFWKHTDLKGTWEVTRKLDGVRALKNDLGIITSRANKPLHNLQDVEFTDAEIFCGDWETSVSAVRTHHGKPVIQEHVYSIEPLDPRLHLGWATDPDAALIESLMRTEVSLGHEGIVLRQGDRWIKVKPRDPSDLRIIGVQEGTGQFKGMLGSLHTAHGKVGTGFTPEQRQLFWELHLRGVLIGVIMEVEHRGVTKNLKMKEPAFKRLRWDKDTETKNWE